MGFAVRFAVRFGGELGGCWLAVRVEACWVAGWILASSKGLGIVDFSLALCGGGLVGDGWLVS